VFSRWAFDADKLSLLADSLQENGQVTPLVVRRVPGREKYLIVCGERRWLAASRDRRARTIRCEVYDDLSEVRALLMRLTDALTHEGFHSLELGEMMARVKELLKCSMRGLARELNASVDEVRRPLSLLRLPPGVQDLVRRGELRPSHACEIARASEGERQAIAERVVGGGLTFEQTAALVRRRREAMGMTSRGRRRWSLRGPGGFKILVTGPPDARRSNLIRALSAVLARVLARRSARTTATRY
jgi:ParB family chromosome partitioning protein